jgi:hypothetical protein
MQKQRSLTQSHRKKHLKSIVIVCVIAFLLCNPFSSNAYSVLTHQALIDANWKDVLAPLLHKRYPHASAEQLKQAKAYAYGGAVAPDMGYYPYGSKLFTNLLHYVRSGDFTKNILAEARNLNEYAFALGVYCHFMADIYGHSLGVNRCVPLIYPKMEKKYGDTVTYAENKISHLRTEFSFDVLQTARGNYVPESYHDFIGFAVADTLLGRAFLKTYGLDMNELFGNLPVAIGTFRWAVKNFIPTITKAAWASRQEAIQKTHPDATGRKFIYHMKTKQYYTEFGHERTRPDFFSNALALLIQILPKKGPLSVLKIQVPGPEVEDIFIKSFDTVLYRYALALSHDPFNISNINFDTGKPIRQGEYPLCDKTYDELLLKLKEGGFAATPTDLKNNILSFYSSGSPAIKRSKKECRKINEALDELKGTVHSRKSGIRSR